MFLSWIQSKSVKKRHGLFCDVNVKNNAVPKQRLTKQQQINVSIPSIFYYKKRNRCVLFNLRRINKG